MRVDDAVVLEAAGKIAAMSPGTTITHLVMEEMLGVRRLEEPQKYYRLVRLLRRTLESNNGIFLHCQNKVGYAILPPGKEIGECIRDVTQGTRRAVRGAMRAQLIRLDRIEDPHERARVTTIAQRTANLAMMLRKGVEEFQRGLLSSTTA